MELLKVENFYVKLTASMVLGVLICLVPMLEKPVLANYVGFFVFGWCGIVIGGSTFLLSIERKRINSSESVFSIGDTFIFGMICAVTILGKYIVFEVDPSDISYPTLGTKSLMMLLPLFGLACFLGGQASQVLGKYTKRKG